MRRARRFRHQFGVIVLGHADKNPGPALTQRQRRNSRMLQCLPRDLKQQPLLRVHADCLTRSNAEETRVEEIHAIDEPAPPCVHLAGGFGIGIVPGFDVPPVRRNFAYGIDPVSEQLPEFRRIMHTAGHPAAHSHNRNRVVAFAIVRCAGRRPQSRCGSSAGDHLLQIRTKRLNVWIVEDRRRPKNVPARKRGLQPSMEFDRHQRCHAQLEETGGRLDTIRINAECRRDNLPHEALKNLRTFR